MWIKKTGIFIEKRVVFISMALFFFSIFVLHTEKIYTLFTTEKYTLKKINKNLYQLEGVSARKGMYFLSLGRPKGPCQILNGSKVVASNMGLNGLRSQLSLSWAFEVSEKMPMISVQCFSQKGFSGGLTTFKPIIMKYKTGFFLQLIRDLALLVLGPVLGLFIFFNYLLQPKVIEKIVRRKFVDLRNEALPLFFSFSMMLYSLSLSHYPRYFFNSIDSSFIHVLLRCFFSLSFVLFIGYFSRKNKLLANINILALVSCLVTFLVNKDSIVNVYKVIYPLITITNIIISFNVFKRKYFKAHSYSLQVICILWSLALSIDLFDFGLFLINSNFRVGLYNAPIVISLISLCLIYFNYSERDDSLANELASRNIIEAVNSNFTLSDILKKIGEIIVDSTGYTRVSIYLDSFVLDREAKANISATRIFEFGYKKNTQDDSIVEFLDNRGLKMKKASKEKREIFEIGNDNASYAIIPISDLAWINVSDSGSSSPFHVNESNRILQKLSKPIQVFENKLIEYTLNSGLAVEKVKSKRGLGEWNLEIGSIFADIVDYSLKDKKYSGEKNKNTFTKFVDSVYMPGLIKAISPRAFPERSKGDEIYAVVIEDFLPEGEELVQGIVETISRFRNYISNEGAHLCKKYGFEPLDWTIGCNIGKSWLFCDDFSMRTSGESVIIASRLQSVCPKNKITITPELKDIFIKNGFRVVEERNCIIKKNYFSAIVLDFPQAVMIDKEAV